MNLNIAEQFIRADSALPRDFRFYRWRCMPEAARETIYVEFTGAVAPLCTRGKRKGEPNWRLKTGVRSFAMTMDEYERRSLEWERENKSCRDCEGSGKTVARISVNEGTTYRECIRCRGTGVREQTT